MRLLRSHLEVKVTLSWILTACGVQWMTKKSDQDLPSSKGDWQRLLGHEQLTHKLMYFHTRWLIL